MTAALACAILALERGRRWLIPWVAILLVLSFTRDSTWIPMLGSRVARLQAQVEGELRSSSAVGLAAVLPAMLAFSGAHAGAPRADAQRRPAGARTRPGARSSATTRRRSSICSRPTAASSATAPGIRRSTCSAASCCCSCSRGAPHGGPVASLMKAAACAAGVYVLAVPIFSAFRLELGLVPMAAFGLALGLERLAARVQAPGSMRAAGLCRPRLDPRVGPVRPSSPTLGLRAADPGPYAAFSADLDDGRESGAHTDTGT